MIRTAVAILLAVCLHSSAAEYRVDAASGSDENDGSAERPFKTIAKAVAALSAGDTLTVAAGKYPAANIIPKRSGKPGAPIVIRAAAGAHSELDGNGASSVLNFCEVSHVTVEGIEFANFRSQAVIAKAASADGANWLTLRNCVAHGGEIFIKSNSGKFRAHHLLVEGCAMFDMNDIPVFVDNMDHVIVRQNAICNAKSVCIDPGGVLNLLVEQNYVVNPRKLGALKIRSGNVEPVNGANCNGAIVRHNVFLEGNRYQILLASANGAMVYNNVLANFGNTPSESGLIFIQREYYGEPVDKTRPMAPNRRNSIRNNVFYLNSGDEVPNNWTCNALIRADKTMDPEMDEQEFDYNLYFKMKGSNYISVLEKFVTKDAVKGWGKGFDAHSIVGADPLFAAGEPMKGPAGFQLKPESPGIDAGGALTTASGDGRGTLLKVADARYFSDGSGMIEGDLIRVGANPALRVTARDIQANTLTLEKEIAWKTGDSVSLDYHGRAPDIGAYESGAERHVGSTAAVERILKRMAEDAGKK